MTSTPPPRPALPHARALQGHLQQLKALRGSTAHPPPRLAELKAWQSQRLRATYRDYAAQPRYREATAFFIDDLYGPKDFTSRDQAMLRILPAMTRILPASAVETAALAIELEALSEDLDQRLAAALPAGPLTAETYARAYRASAAGLGDLQVFLERGFAAFRDMRGADEFLSVIRAREEKILSALFSSAPDPFST